MDFIQELTESYRGYVNAFRLVDEHKLWKIFIVPAFCSLIITAFVIWFAWQTSDNLTRFAIIKFKLGEEYAYFDSFLEFIVVTFIRGLIFFIYIKIYRYLILILMAPEFSYITSIVIAKSTDKSPNFKIKRYFSDIWRGVKIAAGNFVLDILITFAIILLAIIVTWLLPLIPFIIFIVEGYFFGYAMADYRNEYFNIPLKKSRKLIRKHRFAVSGNGILFNIILLIPIFGVLFGPTLAIIASGLSMNEIEHQKKVYAHSIHQSI